MDVSVTLQEKPTGQSIEAILNYNWKPPEETLGNIGWLELRRRNQEQVHECKEREVLGNVVIPKSQQKTVKSFLSWED